MAKRFVSIWFRYLLTDWFTVRNPSLRHKPFVVATRSHGRMIIVAANKPALLQGVFNGMVLADARAIIPSLEVADEIPGLQQTLLPKIAEWCIRFTPFVSIDTAGGLIFDATGCSHLWGGDEAYLKNIIQRFEKLGYNVRAGMADTIGCAWAVTRFSKDSLLIEPGQQLPAISALPPDALRLEPNTIERLHKLGLKQISQFMNMPRAALRRRFGPQLLIRLDEAIGYRDEIIEPVTAIETFQVRLPSIEPILSATGITIAITTLLEQLTDQLKQQDKGLRAANFICHRTDGKTEQISVGTNRPSANSKHLFKLFEERISNIEPGPGIELFILEAPVVEDHTALQSSLWETSGGINDHRLSELLDRFTLRLGKDAFQRFLPAQHYWPERSINPTTDLDAVPATHWNIDRPRPVHLLGTPKIIEVTAPIPDYPPMLFRYMGKLHKVARADGPERIEQEWWIAAGEHRDYYTIEDEDGKRYWVFRSGHYTGDRSDQWYIHGFFA
jgi:protein ImuB